MTDALLAALAAVAAGTVILVDLRRRPNRRCRACSGTGRNSRGIRWGTCGRCHGKGNVRRWGAPGEGRR